MDLDLVSRSPFVPVNNVTRFGEQCTFPVTPLFQSVSSRGEEERLKKGGKIHVD